VIDSFLEAGVNCMHPMEPAAGMDIVKVREKYGAALPFTAASTSTFRASTTASPTARLWKVTATKSKRFGKSSRNTGADLRSVFSAARFGHDLVMELIDKRSVLLCAL